jgi:hypothetical protein
MHVRRRAATVGRPENRPERSPVPPWRRLGDLRRRRCSGTSEGGEQDGGPRKAIKVIGLLSVLRNELLQIIDTVSQWGKDRPGDVDLYLTAGSLTTSQLQNATIPPNSCTSNIGGWEQSAPIKLHNGQGQVRRPGSPGLYTSIIDSSLLGWADFNGDGQRDVALVLRCSGSRIDSCCAGQSSLLNFIGIYGVGPGAQLTLIGPVLGGSKVLPGDQYGPASAAIEAASLNGTTITTDEYVLYPADYTSRQLGGLNPHHAVFHAELASVGR